MYFTFSRPGWKSTFYFSSAMGVICLIGGVLSIPADPPFRLAAAQKLSASETADRRVDWLGAFLVTAGLVFIVFVLSDGETAPNGWKTGCKSHWVF
jgi:predicted MFS family arabinose efflux permease